MQDSTKAALIAACQELTRAVHQVVKETFEINQSRDHVAIIKNYKDVRDAKESTKAAREALQELEDNLSKVVIPEIVAYVRDTSGLKPPFYIDGVGRVSVSYRFSCSMIDKERGIEWLDSNGHGSIAQRTVNSQTLSSFAKNLMEDKGIELPEDIFKTSTSPYTSITKA